MGARGLCTAEVGVRFPSPPLRNRAGPGHTATTTQTGATWGLDRIDQRALPLNGSYTYDATGAGVTAYIIDWRILSYQGSGRYTFDLTRPA